MPADQRQKDFWVGSGEYDPVKVGYRTEQNANASTNGREFNLKTIDENGEPIAGNSNAGHEYGAADFTDRERLALVEYMKGL